MKKKVFVSLSVIFFVANVLFVQAQQPKMMQVTRAAFQTG
jgi:uncharacterized membrane protein